MIDESFISNYLPDRDNPYRYMVYLLLLILPGIGPEFSICPF